VTFGTETGTALLSDAEHVAFYGRLFDEVAELAIYGDEVRPATRRPGGEVQIRSTHVTVCTMFRALEGLAVFGDDVRALLAGVAAPPRTPTS
jgi:hypothetical protein